MFGSARAMVVKMFGAACFLKSSFGRKFYKFAAKCFLVATCSELAHIDVQGLGVIWVGCFDAAVRSGFGRVCLYGQSQAAASKIK